ncbi:phosphoribosyltransferase [Streptomyces lavendofoliae]|uniref:Phosphoribosyltransferase n=1 Tax=Streptomyces lavendofoliae TaxID=67314 RepID=A0A918HUZ2_9ACTN|nr:phosphoribosyltransferase family protein [Streptomyces lavendofoliae]GGU25065.1 phosphoribosyltransferase [Streptomyces lavendofoliae]
MRFQDRREAGRELAAPLVERQRLGLLADPVVLALPRGGVPVADEVARALGAPLDVLVVRKIGAPFNREVGIGALVGEEPPVFDERALTVLGLTPGRLSDRVDAERREARRREELYRGGRPAPALGGRSVVVVDDGLATGVTARAALRAVRAASPARLLLAVPVCSSQATEALAGEADEIVYVYRPPRFEAVGQWYDDFAQLTDDEVLRTLRAAHGG